MDKAGFARFYDNQPDYIAFRNDPKRQEDYKTIVDWKVRKLVGLISDNSSFSDILEVGCAFGVLLNNIADRLKIARRFGIDISGENIKAARELYPDCHFFQGTLEDYIIEKSDQLNKHKFDLVVLSDIIEHIPDDLGFLKSIRGISKLVLLNLPLEKSFRTRNRIYGENDPSGHLRCYDASQAIKLVNSAGFNIVKYFTYIATSDKSYYEVYKKNRSLRINSKPLLMKLFWTLFYALEDKFKLISKGLSERIYGSNFFALLTTSW